MARRTRRQVTRASAFWDASALVPLCVPQTATASSIAFHKTYEVIVWWSASVEIASAVSRLRRMGQLDANDEVKARQASDRLSTSWTAVQPSDIILHQAVRFVTRYELRAGDSLQLAAAWQWCEGLPTGKVFLTYDQKLREAALLVGFDVK